MRLLVTPDGLEPYVITLQPGDAVVVEPVDPDNRTQAERNAQNALDAARLQRVERRLQVHIDGLRMLTAGGAKRIDAAQVGAALADILEAPVA